MLNSLQLFLSFILITAPVFCLNSTHYNATVLINKNDGTNNNTIQPFTNTLNFLSNAT